VIRRASILFLALLFVAGCGGGGGGGGSGGGKSAEQPRLSKADYAAKADAICRKYNKRTEAIGNPKTLSDLAKSLDRAVPLLNNVIAELRALQPPKSEQHTVDRWLAQSEVLKHDFQEMRDKAKAKDTKGLQSAFERASGDVKHGNDLAKKLGLKVCSQ
jgi:hypothetical protein